MKNEVESVRPIKRIEKMIILIITRKAAAVAAVARDLKIGDVTNVVEKPVEIEIIAEAVAVPMIILEIGT